MYNSITWEAQKLRNFPSKMNLKPAFENKKTKYEKMKRKTHSYGK